jgi:photosystem II stability/assembly factor-like uncharacterized protein
VNSLAYFRVRNTFAGIWPLFLVTVASAQWVPVNGLPDGGRVVTMSLKSENIFAGTYNGGVFRSTNKGTSWIAVNSGLTATGITSISSGAGGRVIAASSSGIFFSSDYGSHWAMVDSGLPQRTYPVVAAIGNWMFAGTNIGVFRSSDGGVHWSAVDSAFTIRLFLVNGNELFTWNQRGFFHSTDTGSHWTPADSASAAPGISCMTKMGQTLFAGTSIHGVFRSLDNGAHWTAVDPGHSEAPVRSIAANGTMVFVSYPVDGVFRSDDNGETWTPANAGLTDSMLVNTLEASGSTVFAGTTGKDAFYRSSDNGEHWSPSNSGLRNTTISSIAVIGDNLLTCNPVYLSTNNGTNWKKADSGLPMSYLVTSFGVSQGTVFAATKFQDIFFSRHIDSPWEKVDTAANLVCNPGCGFSSADTIIYTSVGNSGIYRLVPTITGWTSVYAGLRYEGDPFYFDYYDDIRPLAIVGNAIFAGMLRGGVYRLKRGDTAWTYCGLSDQNILALHACGSNWVAGTDSIVFLSNDNGMTWHDCGRKNFRARCFVSSGAGLFSGTADSGVFLSTDCGGTWTGVNSGLGNMEILSLAAAGPTLFAGTAGGGLWARALAQIINNKVARPFRLPRQEPGFRVSMPRPLCWPRIEFAVPRFGRVTICAFDVSGVKIATIVDDFLGIGSYSRTWGIRNVPQGCYVVKLKTGPVEFTQCLAIIR